jgi:hypothetical protein
MADRVEHIAIIALNVGGAVIRGCVQEGPLPHPADHIHDDVEARERGCHLGIEIRERGRLRDVNDAHESFLSQRAKLLARAIRGIAVPVADCHIDSRIRER